MTYKHQNSITKKMILYIDADAIPTIAKGLIIKTANRTQTMAVFVANRPVALPPSPYVSCVVVNAGFDVADHYIALHAHSGDIVITSDIALAYDALGKNAIVFDGRGVLFDKETIAQKLAMRDFLDTLRGSGMDKRAMGQQSAYGSNDKKRLGDALNRFVR